MCTCMVTMVTKAVFVYFQHGQTLCHPQLSNVSCSLPTCQLHQHGAEFALATESLQTITSKSQGGVHTNYVLSQL